MAMVPAILDLVVMVLMNPDLRMMVSRRESKKVSQLRCCCCCSLFA
jgi:hypothetical protein